MLRPHKHGIAVDIILAPRAATSKILGIYQNRLKISVHAPPVNGKANEALISFLGSSLKIPKSRLSIISGQTSKQKTILIEHAAIEIEKKITELEAMFNNF